MIIFSKQCWFISICVFMFVIKENTALTSCLNMSWSINATTVAGSPTGEHGSNASYLTYPADIFVSNNSEIYVLDVGNARVQLWLPNATSGTTLIQGSFDEELAQFTSMSDIDVDNNGNIFILDFDSSRVTKWTPGATFGLVVAGGNGYGPNLNQLNNPMGMYVEKATSIIWIADTDNHRIVKWYSPTNATFVCGRLGNGVNQFSSPFGLFIDENNQNTLYVADTGNYRVQQWTKGATSGKTVAGTTGVSGTASNQLLFPIAVVVYKSQTMFILSDCTVIRWQVGTSFGEVVAGDSICGSLPYQLYNPYNIFVDSNRNIFVADSVNHRIQKFSAICCK